MKSIPKILLLFLMLVFTGPLCGQDTEPARSRFERVLHDYYRPDNGEPMLNKGLQNCNYLDLNMSAWLEGRETVSEF